MFCKDNLSYYGSTSISFIAVILELTSVIYIWEIWAEILRRQWNKNSV